MRRPHRNQVFVVNIDQAAYSKEVQVKLGQRINYAQFLGGRRADFRQINSLVICSVSAL